MLRTTPSCSLIPAVFVCAILAGPAVRHAYADGGYWAVITIYNKSNVPINYQLRTYRNGEWSDWSAQKHTHPRGGWQYRLYSNAENIQIRFDRIGGDDEFTEKIYDLKFNRVDPNREVGHRDGRPYYFQYDAGGRLLDLYRYGW